MTGRIYRALGGLGLMAAKRSPSVPNSEWILVNTWLKVTTQSDVPSRVALSELAMDAARSVWWGAPRFRTLGGVLAGAFTVTACPADKRGSSLGWRACR